MIDLGDKEIFVAIKEEAEDVITSDDGQRADAFIYNLPLALADPKNQDLSVTHPEMAVAYQTWADQLSFVAIPALKPEEIVALFKDKLSVGLRLPNLDLIAKLKAVFLAISAFSNRDQLRAELREALKANQEHIGSLTIANWLKKYETDLGVRTVGSLDLNQWLANNKDAQALPEAEQSLMRRLVNLYEYLKLSSQTPEGLEDPVIFDNNGQLRRLNAGEWEDVKVETKLAGILDKIIKFFNPASSVSPVAASVFNLAPVAAAARALLAETGGDIKAARDRLDAAVRNKSRDQGLALILLLAQLRDLDNLLVDDQRFNALVAADLKEQGQDDMLQGFQINPVAPNFIARFLRIILQEKLGLAEGEALAFADKLGAILALEGEKYGRIVIKGENGELRWNL